LSLTSSSRNCQGLHHHRRLLVQTNTIVVQPKLMQAGHQAQSVWQSAQAVVAQVAPAGIGETLQEAFRQRLKLQIDQHQLGNVGKLTPAGMSGKLWAATPTRLRRMPKPVPWVDQPLCAPLPRTADRLGDSLARRSMFGLFAHPRLQALMQIAVLLLVAQQTTERHRMRLPVIRHPGFQFGLFDARVQRAHPRAGMCSIACVGLPRPSSG
jgi:hypothetical protein